MTTFVPLNVEIEEESEDEIDDSKEIQIEEALKLYQNALKLHSQGPEYYDEAENAYDELFRSEIFTYEESLSESRRIQEHCEVEESGSFEDSLTPALTLSAPPTDGAPSTLPQILYLAYKNHGQFLLDRLKYQLSRVEQEIRSEDVSITVKDTSIAASASLKLFIEALDRDDTDLELWRQVSRIGGYLGSRRIARFCLEAVLDTDEASFDTWTEPPGLEESFAVEQLKSLLQLIDDQLSKSQFPLISNTQQSIIDALRRHIDPCPFLPEVSPCQAVEKLGDGRERSARPQFIKVLLYTWASCGKAILLQLSQEAQGIINPDPGASYSLVLPPKQSEPSSAPPVKPLANGKSPVQPDRPILIDERSSAKRSQTEEDAPDTSNTVTGLADPMQTSPVDLSGCPPEQVLASPTKTGNGDNPEAERFPETKRPENQGDQVQEAVKGIGPVSLPTRKRSSDDAELPDSTDFGRSRSKRIKARESLADPNSLKDTTADDWSQWYEQQLQMYHQADGPIFEAAGNLLSKIGCKSPKSFETLKKIMSGQILTSGLDQANSTAVAGDLAAQDLKNVLNSWDLGKSKAMLNGHDSKVSTGSVNGAQNQGFTAFLEHSSLGSRKGQQRPISSGEDRLGDFVSRIGQRTWMPVDLLAFDWILELLMRNKSPLPYQASQWPDALKETVVQMLVNHDEIIISETNRLVSRLSQQSLDDVSQFSEPKASWYAKAKQDNTDFVQTIFELHLDVYGRITNPSSLVDGNTRIMQRDRLSRWATLASQLIKDNPTSRSEAGESLDHLSIRFLWSYVIYTSQLESSTRDYSIACLQNLKGILTETARHDGIDRLVIDLPNNAVMPEISIEAAEKEISRLTTMDFFMSVFSSENNDPLTVIDSLEPLLELSTRNRASMFGNGLDNNIGNDQSRQNMEPSPKNHTSGYHAEAPPDPKLLETLHFLDRANLSLKLYLWQKLRDAYSAISYPPQVFSCNLRSLIIIIDYLGSSSYRESTLENRHESLLRWLHRLDDLISRMLKPALFETGTFECVDSEHVRTSLEAVAILQKILHVFALWEDTIRVGQVQPPIQANQSATKAQMKATDKIRDMIVKTWLLQYTLMKEAITQNPDLFSTPNEDLIQYLKLAHQALGLRFYCGLINKMFLKLMKAELERHRLVEGWDAEMAQVISDLYGLKISTSVTDFQDHGCQPEDLDRHTAFEIMDLVILQVNRISIKDLLKCDLKFAVDKMQQVIKVPKTANATARTFNNRLVNNYLKSPINPIELYRSLQGLGGLCASPVLGEGSEIATKGWYFLLGHIALAKFRSQKRSGPMSTEDLDVARIFLRHDLECDTEKWEAWYRLAQVYDTMIEEDTTWTAEKLDNDMDDLVALQRKSIHCYSMAVAVAIRCADASFDVTSKIADLYADYGARIYAATREPFSMKAFSLDDFQRHYSSTYKGMYKEPPFRRLHLYPAWKFASVLLRKASAQKPQNWVISYMLGKVLWKLHNCADEVRGAVKRIDPQPVIDAFVRAIETCPERRDSRHPEKEPILEPHYKLVSVVHKLVQSKRLSAEEGCRILKTTPYSRKAPSVQNAEEWEGYMLQVLKALRSADKANWHHRMVARAAHTIYDDDPQDPRAALGAKHELNQQIFSKTMAIQVWKPGNERPGRHFVYTGRYVRFFVRLLYQLNDKSSLEALARRIRKKTNEFENHASVWQEVCMAYIRLLHHQPGALVPEGYSELIFQGMDPEHFQTTASRLETQMHSPSGSSPILEILREAIELKKLNNNYYKTNAVEDLVADLYARLYESVIPELLAKDAAEENRVRMSVDNILAVPTISAAQIQASDPSAMAGGDQPAAARTKAKYVTRREIIRKAEAIAAKPAPIVAAKPLKNLAPAPALEHGKPPNDAQTPIVVIPEDPIKDPGSSVPGSVHDSADDESELSEVDEEVVEESKPSESFEENSTAMVAVKVPPPPLFPNLVNPNAEAEDEESVTIGRGSDEMAGEEAEKGNEDEDEDDRRGEATDVGELTNEFLPFKASYLDN